MQNEVFSAAWAQQWATAINRNEEYRQAAQKWEWPVVFVLEQDEPDNDLANVRLYLDLWQGECRAARLANDDDLSTAPFVIRASRSHWLELLAGQLDPIIALTAGKLRLERGSLVTLARFGKAAKLLVESARRVAVSDSVDQYNGKAMSRDDVFAFKPRTGFVTTSTAGLRHDLLPMQLYHKAKRLGTWNPQDIDFHRDREDWQNLSPLEKEVLLHLASLFQAGEEAVTLDLLPLIMTIAREGRLEEEMFLTTFLWEEAKHTEFFRRFFDEIALEHGDLTRFHTPAYCKLFYQELPGAMQALLADPSPAAQLRASVTYNAVVEGTLAETGYHAYYTMLERNHLMPGMQQGVTLLKRDESRHIAYGLYLISRLIAADHNLWPVVEQRMAEVLELGLQSINEVFACYETLPFGLRQEDFVEYALHQFNRRLQRLERARQQTVEEICADLSYETA